MRIAVIFFTIFLGIANKIQAQNPAQFEEFAEKRSSEIKWLNWNEAMQLYQKDPKKLLISIYTRWCNWCKKMDASTFGEPEIALLVNDSFYAVKLDAQCTEELTFKGKTYKNRNEGLNSYHDLALELLNDRRSFPTIVFLDEQLQFIQAIVGYKTASEFETIASYFGYNDYKKTPWSSYEKNFQSTLSLRKN